MSVSIDTVNQMIDDIGRLQIWTETGKREVVRLTALKRTLESRITELTGLKSAVTTLSGAVNDVHRFPFSEMVVQDFNTKLASFQHEKYPSESIFGWIQRQKVPTDTLKIILQEILSSPDSGKFADENLKFGSIKGTFTGEAFLVMYAASYHQLWSIFLIPEATRYRKSITGDLLDGALFKANPTVQSELLKAVHNPYGPNLLELITTLSELPGGNVDRKFLANLVSESRPVPRPTTKELTSILSGFWKWQDNLGIPILQSVYAVWSPWNWSVVIKSTKYETTAVKTLFDWIETTPVPKADLLLVLFIELVRRLERKEGTNVPWINRFKTYLTK